jgi:hypothetical protein
MSTTIGRPLAARSDTEYRAQSTEQTAQWVNAMRCDAMRWSAVRCAVAVGLPKTLGPLPRMRFDLVLVLVLVLIFVLALQIRIHTTRFACYCRMQPRMRRVNA